MLSKVGCSIVQGDERSEEEVYLLHLWQVPKALGAKTTSEMLWHALDWVREQAAKKVEGVLDNMGAETVGVRS